MWRGQQRLRTPGRWFLPVFLDPAQQFPLRHGQHMALTREDLERHPRTRRLQGLGGGLRAPHPAAVALPHHQAHRDPGQHLQRGLAAVATRHRQDRVHPVRHRQGGVEHPDPPRRGPAEHEVVRRLREVRIQPVQHGRHHRLGAGFQGRAADLHPDDRIPGRRGGLVPVSLDESGEQAGIPGSPGERQHHPPRRTGWPQDQQRQRIPGGNPQGHPFRPRRRGDAGPAGRAAREQRRGRCRKQRRSEAHRRLMIRRNYARRRSEKARESTYATSATTKTTSSIQAMPCRVSMTVRYTSSVQRSAFSTRISASLSGAEM